MNTNKIHNNPKKSHARINIIMVETKWPVLYFMFKNIFKQWMKP